MVVRQREHTRNCVWVIAVALLCPSLQLPAPAPPLVVSRVLVHDLPAHTACADAHPESLVLAIVGGAERRWRGGGGGGFLKERLLLRGGGGEVPVGFEPEFSSDLTAPELAEGEKWPV